MLDYVAQDSEHAHEQDCTWSEERLKQFGIVCTGTRAVRLEIIRAVRSSLVWPRSLEVKFNQRKHPTFRHELTTSTQLCNCVGHHKVLACMWEVEVKTLQAGACGKTS